MSYFADHLAWQQRVAQEFKATTQFQEANAVAKPEEYIRYPDLVNYLLTNKQAHEGEFTSNRMGMSSAFQQNVTDYSYKGKTNLLLRSKSQAGNTGMPQSTKAMSQASRRFDAMSQSHSQISKTSKKSSSSVFNQNLQKKRRARFNENLDKSDVRSMAGSSRLSARSARSLNASSLAGLQNAQKQNEGSVTYVSAATKAQLSKRSSVIASTEASRRRRTETHKANILDVVNRLSEQELEKVSEMLKQSELAESEVEVSPYVDLPVEEEQQNEEVIEMPVEEINLDSVSITSSKVMALQDKLQSEKSARIILENELAQLKMATQEIVNKLQ